MSQKDGGGQDEAAENEKDEDQKQMHSHKNTDDLSDDGEYFEVRTKDSIQYAYPVPSSMIALVSSRICE